MPAQTLKTSFFQLFGKSNSSDILFGKIDFSQNPKLIIRLLAQHTEKHKHIPSFDNFRNLLRKNEPLPKAPDENDLVFMPSAEQLNQLSSHRLSGNQKKAETTITAFNYFQAKREYEKELRSHSKISKRTRLIAQTHNSDIGGYRSFLCDPSFEPNDLAVPCSLSKTDRSFFLHQPKFQLREADRQRHTYITAGTGHGKSVTIETLIHHYVSRNYSNDPNDQPCVILLDPHGDLAEAVARFKSPPWMKDWLVYIKPALSTSLTPTINPFDIKSKNWNDIALATDAFIEVFREVMKSDKDGTNFSPQMVTILKPCIATLLHMENTSVADLIPFLSDDRAEYQTYLNHAQRHLSNPSQLEFLKRDFFKDSYNPSKMSIKTKVRNLLADDYFFNFLCGPTTLDLEDAIYRRSVILFDLSDLTDAADSAIGRFVMATITKFAFAQGEKPHNQRVPVHLFVDECQDFISESMKKIVTKTRKFRLYGTFAQQICGQGMDRELKRAIIGNSYIKISGDNEVGSLKTISAETGASVEELQALSTGHFHVKAGKAPSVAVKIPMVPKSDRLNNSEWQARKHAQIKLYYRKIEHLNKPQNTDGKANPKQVSDVEEYSFPSKKRQRKPAYKIDD